MSRDLEERTGAVDYAIVPAVNHDDDDDNDDDDDDDDDN